MFNWFNKVVKDYQKPETYELLVTDTSGEKHSLAGLCASLAKEVIKLEERITKLEAENIELTNCLYEVENRLIGVVMIIPKDYCLKAMFIMWKK